MGSGQRRRGGGGWNDFVSSIHGCVSSIHGCIDKPVGEIQIQIQTENSRAGEAGLAAVPPRTRVGCQVTNKPPQCSTGYPCVAPAVGTVQAGATARSRRNRLSWLSPQPREAVHAEKSGVGKVLASRAFFACISPFRTLLVG